MSVFVNEKGELVKVDGPMGMEMIPEDIEKPMGPPPTTPIDLASVSSIAADSPIEDPNELAELKIVLSGNHLPQIPSDEHQTSTKTDGDWMIDIQPPRIDATPGATIAEAAAMQPNWTKPSLDIPSDQASFKELAQNIAKGKPRVRDAALSIRRYVHKIMHPNAGIGVVRDANDVWNTKEGVCRDYAILTATLLRASGIPARLSSGLECFEGRFYYHAWAEAWDGKRWIGIDSTVNEDQISAGHLKLASGQVEDAFVFPVLEKAKIKVLAQRRSGN